MFRTLFAVCSVLWASSLALAASDCTRLSVTECGNREGCTVSGQVCVSDAKCSDITSTSECDAAYKCKWNLRKKCVERRKVKCSKLRSKIPCFAYRREGCRFVNIDGNFKCVHEDNVRCSDFKGLNCRRLSKCLWLKEEKKCVRDNPSERCPDCSDVVCPPIRCSPDAEEIIPEGQCCPTCVLKPKCEDTCRTVRCREGEKFVVEPGDCCPTCRKTCPCPQEQCDPSQCSSLPCKKDEEAIAYPGECCKTCVNRRCRTADCKQTLNCELGEMVVTEPGECCPSCKKVEQCMDSLPESSGSHGGDTSDGTSDGGDDEPGDDTSDGGSDGGNGDSGDDIDDGGNDVDNSNAGDGGGNCFVDADCDIDSGEVCYTGFNFDCDEDCNDKTCPGTCVKEAKTPQGLCGGFGGFPCPDGFECVDLKGDGCSSNCGGADCGGICVEKCPVPKNSGCNPREYEPVKCGRCTYNSLCQALATGFTEEECERSVVPECRKDNDCPFADEGEVCYPLDDTTCDVDCNGIDCPGVCVFARGSCGSDSICPEGSVCKDKKGDSCSPNCNEGGSGGDCAGICIPTSIFE